MYFFSFFSRFPYGSVGAIGRGNLEQLDETRDWTLRVSGVGRPFSLLERGKETK